MKLTTSGSPDHFPPMQTVFPPERDSIFGDTYGGVPNPHIPHVHPWPTRYHGPNYTVPDSNMSYRERPYAKEPFLGLPRTSDIIGSGLQDAAIGAGVGYLVAPSTKDRMIWVLGGGAAGLIGGLLGVVATGGAGLYMRQK